MNLNDLLEGTLDNLADKPEFKPFPAGLHVVQTFFAQKKINDVDGIEVKLKYREVQELTNPEDKVPEAGAEVTIFLGLTAKDQFQRDMAQGTFKDICKALVEKFGPGTPNKLMEQGQGGDAAVVTSVRENKDKTAKFTQLQKIGYI